MLTNIADCCHNVEHVKNKKRNLKKANTYIAMDVNWDCEVDNYSDIEEVWNVVIGRSKNVYY